jgi:hypothetical protein
MRKLVLFIVTAALLAAAPVKLGPKKQLFNGRNLDGFYTFVRGHGVGQDPNHIFTVERGQIRVSGAEYAYFSTKDEYENYYLRVEFRWGQKTHPPRIENARDSGVLFHASGPDKIWPRSIEFQMIEGGTGDIILVDGTSLTVKGETRSKGRFDRFGKGPWKDVVNYRDPAGEVEKPLGRWNVLELWAEGDRVRLHVNGKLVNEGVNASVRRGKILFQSEGAEVFFRKIELRPVQ